MNKYSTDNNRFATRLVLMLFIIMACLTSLDSRALGLSTFRIYMDNNKRTENFVVYNKELVTQHCTQFLRHYTVDSLGALAALPLDVIPSNAANDWIRFSPKKFSVKPGSSQTVKFHLKRRAKTIAAEYRAHLSLECQMDTDEKAKLTNIINTVQPKLRHNIPIIVRTGKLDASVDFSNITFDKDVLNVDINRKGQRSVYGSLAIIDSRSNKIITQKKHVTLYQETVKKTVSLSTSGVEKRYLILKFSESKNSKKGIVVQQKLG